MKKVLLVTFSDNADHQDTLIGMYEEIRKRNDWDAYLLCIKTPKVELQQSDHTWLVDCPERPGVTKKTFNLPLLLSIIHRIRREHFDAIYFESLHTWNLPIMMMSGKAKTYQVIHEVIPHEGDSQVKMVDLMNKAVVKFADTIVLRNKTYIQDMIDRYGISTERVKYLELWRRYATSPSGKEYTPDLDANDLYHFHEEAGLWTVYASVSNQNGTYEAQKPEDFVEILVTDISPGPADALAAGLLGGEDFISGLF